MFEPFEGILPLVDSSAFVHARATLIGRVTIGPECSIWPGVVMRGDDGTITVGSQTSIQDGTVVHLTRGLSNTIIGSRVTIGHNATIHGCTIEDDTLIGIGAIVLDNARVCSGSIVGAGTIVPMNKTVPSGVLVVGNPFRVVRELRESDRQWIEASWRTYVEKAQVYRSARGLR